MTEAPSGGGATYVIPGVAEANGSSVPMLVFTSDIPVIDEGKGTLTAIDQQRLLQAATKWSAVVKRPQMLPDIVRRAFRAATSGRGGACPCRPSRRRADRRGIVYSDLCRASMSLLPLLSHTSAQRLTRGDARCIAGGATPGDRCRRGSGAFGCLGRDYADR